jgi:DNA (cytosine-5)-methyltransferase 1
VASVRLEDAARRLGISQKALRCHIAADTVRVTRDGGSFRVPVAEIRRFRGTAKASALPKRHPVPRLRAADDVSWTDIRSAWKRPGQGRLTFADLFCGAGGLSKGLELAGLRGTCGLDHLDAAVATHRRNFRHPIVAGDIRAPDVKRTLLQTVGEHLAGASLDVVVGGFPCQGFSLSGYRVVNDERNSLYREMLDLVSQLEPRFVVAENVVGIRSMLGGKLEQAIVADFEALGYSMSVAVLSAADYHVPQVRQRVFFVGNRIGKLSAHPAPLLDPSEYVTTRDTIGDLMDHPSDPAFNHVPTRHSPEMARRLAAVPEGRSLYAGYSDAWKKCLWDAPSCTIKENHGGVNIHPRLPRVLTAREMARLQSFPDSFTFAGSKSEQLVQIGNAVPPLLAKAVGLAVRAMAGELPN